MTTILTARRLSAGFGEIDYPVLTITDGIITGIDSDPAALANETTTLTAAFLDIHTHGALGHDVMTASPAGLSQMQRFLASHGTAQYLPTTVTASVDSTLRALESLADAIETTTPANEATPIGIHLEGPFLSHAKRGVHPLADLQPPSIALFDRLYAAARGHVSLMTIAPELGQCNGKIGHPEASASGFTDSALKGTGFSPSVAASEEIGALAPEGNSALGLIRHATSLGVRISLGHSNALAAETLPAIAAGATSATHAFNAMRALDHREPGILGTVLDTEDLYAELIADGIHVAPPLVRLWLKAKGPDRAILVTDAMPATGMPDGDYSLAGQPVTVRGDRASLTADPATLAGSVLTLDRAVANLQTFTGVSLAEATRLASQNPARLLGHRLLDPGSPAHLNRFSADGRFIATYLHGNLVTNH
jgi:N-acetylglucosamine-6-phosphate deacetylase